MTILRTEEWTKDVKGMTSTVVVVVYAGELVRVSDPYIDEFELNRDWALERVNTVMEKFYHEFDYGLLSTALVRDGWTHGSTSED